MRTLLKSFYFLQTLYVLALGLIVCNSMTSRRLHTSSISFAKLYWFKVNLKACSVSFKSFFSILNNVESIAEDKLFLCINRRDANGEKILKAFGSKLSSNFEQRWIIIELFIKKLKNMLYASKKFFFVMQKSSEYVFIYLYSFRKVVTMTVNVSS